MLDYRVASCLLRSACVPIYEYRCEACGHTFEVMQKFSDPPVESCEVCGGLVVKVFHPVAIHFRGSGFYTTDYGRSAKGARAGRDEGETKPAAESGQDKDAKATKEGGDNRSGGSTGAADGGTSGVAAKTGTG
jgi:putative FmdB family regulatory protein